MCLILFRVAFQQASQLFGNLSNSIKSCIQSGIDFDSSLREFSAITGQTGEGLQLIGKYARESAKIFGGSASNKVLDTNEAILAFLPFLELFDIDGSMMKIAIKEYSVSQKTYTNRQDISIKTVSDYDYTIYSEEN